MVERLRVHLVGDFMVDGFDLRELGSRKGRTLLKVLALHTGRSVSIDALAEALWGDSPPRRPGDQIGVLVSRLRGVLGAERITRTDTGYELRADWTDLVELRDRTEQASGLLDDGRISAARAAALAALSLVRGPMFADEDGQWPEAARAEVAALASSARRVAIDAALTTGDLATVVREAEPALVHDPYDESVVLALMQAHARAGRPASALAAYARLRERLVEDLGASPNDAVETLHTALLLGDVDGVGDGTDDPAQGILELAGRDVELQALDDALDEVRAGAGTIVALEGEAGMGKSALLRVWLHRAERSGAVVFSGRCDELGRDLPLQPIADALADALGTDEAALDSMTASDRALLAESLGIGTVPDSEPVDGDAEPMATRLYAAMVRAVEAVAAGRPTVIAIDDLQLAGRSTLGWLAFAARRYRTGLLVLGARRPVPGGPPLPGETVIPIRPLGLADVEALIGGDRAEELLRRSGGNPLLLTALAGQSVDTAHATVADAAAHHLASLGTAADTVRAAAVLGQDIDLDLVAAVRQVGAAEVLDDLEAGVRVGLLVEADLGFAFRHDLIREAIADEVTAARRALVHRDAARVLGRRPRRDAPAIALHARLGGDRELAVEALLEAAAAAEIRHDPEAALGYLDTAVALLDEAATRTPRARVLLSLVRLDDAARDIDAAINGGGGAEALEIAAWIAYYRRRYDDAQQLADAAESATTEPAARVGAQAVAARVRHGRGDLAGALAVLERVDEGPASVRAVADVWHAHAFVHAGRPAEALQLVDRAFVVGDRMAQPFAPLHGRFARTMALGYVGRLGDALESAEDLFVSVDRFGAVGVRFVAPTANLRAWTRRIVGRHDEADELNEVGLATAGGGAGPSSPGMAEAYWVSLLDLVDGALHRGDLDRAHDLLDQLDAMDDWTGTMAWHQRHRLGVLRARAALATGDAERAAPLLVGVRDDADRRGSRRYQAIADMLLLAAGPPGDRRVEPVGNVLDATAGAEAWWLTGLVAEAWDSDALRSRARDRAAAAIASAGPDADSLTAWVDRTLS